MNNPDLINLAETVADWPWQKIGWLTLAGVGAVALLTATSLTALWVGLNIEDRRIRRNREASKRLVVENVTITAGDAKAFRRALDAAADRGTR